MTGATEEQVRKAMDRSPMNKIINRWVSVGNGNIVAARMNWVSTLPLSTGLAEP